jgi:hypothetical protein
MNQLKTHSEIAQAHKFAAIRDIKVKVLRCVECGFIGGREIMEINMPPGTQELLMKRIGTKNEVIFPRFCNHFCLNAFALGVSWWAGSWLVRSLESKPPLQSRKSERLSVLELEGERGR